MMYARYTMMLTLLFTVFSCKKEHVPTINDYKKVVPENVSLSDYSPTSITVAWDRIEEAASYTVQLLDSIDATSPLDAYTTVSGSEYVFGGLDETTGYYVRVRANFNTPEHPVIGDWVYVMNDQKQRRIMPKYGFVEEGFEEPEAPAPKEEFLYPDFPESFEEPEGKRKGSYTGKGPTGEQSEFYPTGEWGMFSAYSLDAGSALVHKVGKYAVMLSPHTEAFLSMDFDLPNGANKLTFVCGSATKTNKNDVDNMPITLSVFYSTDGGESWVKIDDIVIDDVETQYTPVYDNLGIEGPVRFKFQKDDGIARPIVDEVAVYYTN